MTTSEDQAKDEAERKAAAGQTSQARRRSVDSDSESYGRGLQSDLNVSVEKQRKLGEKFAEGIKNLRPAGDPTDFAQERIDTIPENRSEHALDEDDELYPEETDEAREEREKIQDPSKRTDDDLGGDDTGPHPTDEEKREAETKRVSQGRTSVIPTKKN